MDDFFQCHIADGADLVVGKDVEQTACHDIRVTVVVDYGDGEGFLSFGVGTQRNLIRAGAAFYERHALWQFPVDAPQRALRSLQRHSDGLAYGDIALREMEHYLRSFGTLVDSLQVTEAVPLVSHTIFLQTCSRYIQRGVPV